MTPSHTQDMLAFIDASPSPYHAASALAQRLEGAGFHRLAERDAWRVAPGGQYVFVRGGKTVVAVRIGTRPLAEAGARILAAHSDSPCLKVRQNPVKGARDAGLLETEIYGSPLLHTWLDRDLKLAGCVWTGGGVSGAPVPTLVDVPGVRVRVNSLAPHLKKEKRTEQVTVDRHKDLKLFFSGDPATAAEVFGGLLKEAAGGEPLAVDLCLADTQASALCGEGGAFISAPRLDNLFNAWCAVEALIAGDADHEATRIAVVYDAEEIGSGTWTGAKSNLLEEILTRIGGGEAGTDGIYRAKARSILLSADMAHSEHPSFKDATDPDHVPSLNGGLAIKSGAMGNYAIGHGAEAWVRAVCDDEGLPLQRFMYRCDHGGGSSVGPITTTSAGIAGVDLGAPMLAMHSIREMAGAKDVAPVLRAYTALLGTPRTFTAS